MPGAVKNTRCNKGHQAYRQALATDVPGSTSVDVVMCPTCDRVKCKGCTVIDLTGTATRCGCGRLIGLHA